MAPVGVDEWVARSGDKREQATGLRGLLARLGERVGWWPRLALLAIGGFVFAQLGINVNEQTEHERGDPHQHEPRPPADPLAGLGGEPS